MFCSHSHIYSRAITGTRVEIEKVRISSGFFRNLIWTSRVTHVSCRYGNPQIIGSTYRIMVWRIRVGTRTIGATGGWSSTIGYAQTKMSGFFRYAAGGYCSGITTRGDFIKDRARYQLTWIVVCVQCGPTPGVNTMRIYNAIIIRGKYNYKQVSRSYPRRHSNGMAGTNRSSPIARFDYRKVSP